MKRKISAASYFILIPPFPIDLIKGFKLFKRKPSFLLFYVGILSWGGGKLGVSALLSCSFVGSSLAAAALHSCASLQSFHNNNIDSSLTCYHLHHSITIMKIQSSLLILAAMVGYATAANKRKRGFKIYSREEIRAAEEATRSLKKEDKPAKNEKPVVEAIAVPAVQSMSMTLSPTGAPVILETIATPATAMSMMTKCTFCDGMEFDPDLDLNVQDQTCGTVYEAAIKLDATDENCAKAQVAETICCPPELVLTPPVMSMPITTAATEAALVPATEGVPAEDDGDEEAPVQGVPESG